MQLSGCDPRSDFHLSTLARPATQPLSFSGQQQQIQIGLRGRAGDADGGHGGPRSIAAGYVRRDRAAPLIRLGILRNGPLVRANLGADLLVGSVAGFQFIGVLYLQELRSWTELQIGLALRVIGIDAILALTLTPWLMNRFGNGRVVFGGFAFAVLGYAPFLPLSTDWSYAAMLPSLLLLGLAFA